MDKVFLVVFFNTSKKNTNSYDLGSPLILITYIAQKIDLSVGSLLIKKKLLRYDHTQVTTARSGNLKIFEA